MTTRNHRSTGIWIIGALGEVATTLMTGTLALRQGLASTAGLVTELPPFSRMSLAPLDTLVFGGADIRDRSLPETAREIGRRSRSFSEEILSGTAESLAAIDDDITIEPRLAWDPRRFAPELPSLGELVDMQRRMLREFTSRHRLDHLLVVDLSSAEPAVAEADGHRTMEGFAGLVENDRKDLVPPSMAWAYAAFLEGCSHVNFTPNAGAAVPALQGLALDKGLAYYGNDGKTGETLVKTALAPMFVHRNLRIMSWEGVNLLGNNDGRTLADSDHRRTKLAHKAGVLGRILPYPAHSQVTINYVPSLGDWKTAWDMIHFQGFLDVPMTMQFTWQGCDSLLAAPLLLDIVRFGEFAARHGEAGPMRHLASFFKHPIGVEEMAFFPQFEMLLDYARRHLAREDAGGADG